MREAFDWLKPSLLWQTGLESSRAPDFFQPQLFELTDDNFMAQFRAAAAASDSSALRQLVMEPPATGTVKLFQPAHGRYYLVCAALSCRVPGFPERRIQRNNGENVFFVMRRFVAGTEYGWVINGTSKSWQPLSNEPRRVLDQEERLQLFPIAGSDTRTILIGYVPVASREGYTVSGSDLQAAMSDSERAALPDGIDIRIEELEGRFTTQLTKKIGGSTGTILEDAKKASQSLIVSIYMLLDLWEYLDVYLPDVAVALRDDPTTAFTGDQAAGKTQLMQFLAGFPPGVSYSLADALGAVARNRDALNATGGADPASLGLNYDLEPIAAAMNANPSLDQWITDFENAVRAALPPELPGITLPPLSSLPGETFAIRCVYERPQCMPPLRVLSQPTMPFQLAAHFDADAPARPIRIVLPTDVSVAGLRKFRKGVSILVSNSMQKKINMLTGHESDIITDGTAGSDSNGIAWMCSYSIQIIFIIAFFLLLMFLIILNICFWWIAFFKICIPIPKKLISG
jgi:hypothetical protein